MILGTYKREYPRGYVMRGWDPQNPTTLSSALPVNKDVEGKPDEIQPGMIISPDSTGTKWVLGVPTDATAASKNRVAFAQDGVERWDVMAADSLVGLLCSGKFRFATPFFARYTKDTSTADSTDESPGTPAVYVAGTPLTYCLNDEEEWAATAVNVNTGELVRENRSLAGFIRPAEAGEPVIGYVAETHNGLNRAASYGEYSDGELTNGIPARADQISIGKAVDSTSKFTNAYMVIWDSAL